jgi:hypothetical protein
MMTITKFGMFRYQILSTIVDLQFPIHPINYLAYLGGYTTWLLGDYYDPQNQDTYQPSSITCGNQTWQWTITHLQMIFPALDLHLQWDFSIAGGYSSKYLIQYPIIIHFYQ